MKKMSKQVQTDAPAKRRGRPPRDPNAPKKEKQALSAKQRGAATLNRLLASVKRLKRLVPQQTVDQFLVLLESAAIQISELPDDFKPARKDRWADVTPPVGSKVPVFGDLASILTQGPYEVIEHLQGGKMLVISTEQGRVMIPRARTQPLVPRKRKAKNGAAQEAAN